MARSDGCVIINTHLNDKEAVDELNRLTKKIDALNEKISDKKQEQMPLVEQSTLTRLLQGSDRLYLPHSNRTRPAHLPPGSVHPHSQLPQRLRLRKETQ